MVKLSPWGGTVLHLTSPLTEGPKVKEAQTLLHTNRWGVNFRPGVVDGQYGSLSAHASRRAKYYLGYSVRSPMYNLTFGAQLFSYLVPVTDPAHQRLPLRYRLRRALRIRRARRSHRAIKRYNVAFSQVGYQGSGFAGICSKYGAWYGMTCANWCAMFISWCDSQAGGSFHYAFVPFIVGDAEAGRNGLSLTDQPRRGKTAVCWDWTGDGVWDHVELFDENVNSTTIMTIGGNSGSINGVPGGEVLRQERSLTIRHCFVNIYG